MGGVLPTSEYDSQHVTTRTSMGCTNDRNFKRILLSDIEISIVHLDFSMISHININVLLYSPVNRKKKAKD